MQRLPKLLSPSELHSAHSAAHSLLGCDSYNHSARACNATVVSAVDFQAAPNPNPNPKPNPNPNPNPTPNVDFQAALLRAALALGLLSIHDLHELLPAEVRVRVRARAGVRVTVH